MLANLESSEKEDFEDEFEFQRFLTREFPKKMSNLRKIFEFLKEVILERSFEKGHSDFEVDEDSEFNLKPDRVQTALPRII